MSDELITDETKENKDLAKVETPDKDKEYLTEEEIEISEVEATDEEKDILTSEIINMPASFTLPEFSNKLNKGIFYKPNFQRNKVWNPKGQSRFIESLLFDYPVPQVFLYKEQNKESYLIVDGYQRISTVHAFLSNEFRLQDVCDEYNKKYFNELSEDAQERLRNRQLTACIIRQINPNDVQTLYHIFERLNTGGQNLNNMEVRRAVNYGTLIQELEELNTDENWRKILGKKDIDKRFIDLELLLRLVAFYESWNNSVAGMDGYTSMKPFLNSYLSRNRDNSKKDFSLKFIKATKFIVDQLGEKPFTLYTRYNYVLLDSVMTAVIIKDSEIENLKDKYEKLKNDPDYKAIYEAKQGTISIKSVNDRVRIAMSILK